MQLSFMCPLNFLSYGLASRNILRELSKSHHVSLFPIGQISGIEEQEKGNIVQALENAKSFDYNAKCVKLFHAHDLAIAPRCSEKIGYPVFELDRFTEIEKHSLLSCDRLFVCSKWAREVCLSQFDMPVDVVPLGVDISVFKPTLPKNGETFQILSVGKIEIRKGHDILPKIISLAFKSDDNFKLAMSWHNAFMEPEEMLEWERYYKSMLGEHVEFVPRISTSELVDLYSYSNVFISPSRAEGFSLPTLEALACGTNVIVTNYSAFTEYCTPDNSKLIDITGMETADDGKWFTSGCGSWSVPYVEHAAQLLRQSYEDWKWDGPRMNVAGIETAKKFTWANTAAKIVEAINK